MQYRPPLCFAQKGGTVATTRIMSLHVGKGKTARQSIQERLDYIMNPDKTDCGLLISSHACSPETAAEEFMLNRQEYMMNTGREHTNEVLAYHVRQAFKPGEVSPQEANEIGKELAQRLTDDQYAYVVATHIDKHHVHNHIIISSTALDCLHKYRDVKKSGKDLILLSDSLCREHGLSVIRHPQEKSVSYDKWQGNQKKITHRDFLRMTIDAALRMQPDGFDALMQLLEDAGCLIRRGAHISIKPPEGERYIRLDSLGPEYNEDTLRRTLAGDHVHIPKVPRRDYTESQVKRLIDIEAKLRSGKGKGYQVWAERNNIDAKAKMIIFMKEHQIGSINELNDQIQSLQAARNEKKASLQEKQSRMKEINRLRQAIRDYGRTKEIYTQYRESGWSPNFYHDYRQEIKAHKNAQAVYSRVGDKMPTLKELTAEYDILREKTDQEKTEYSELKSRLTDLKRIRYNFNLLERDTLTGTITQNKTADKER